MPIDGAPANGKATAPVTLIEVSDYHCPFCRRHFQQTQPQLNTNYVNSGKVRHVFMHYPIDQLHPDAFRSHEAASCAADQGKFWDLHAKLFEAPARTIDQLIPLGQSVGLNVDAFRTCLESGKHAQEVKESVARIQKMGISGTPAFLIGRTPSGNEPMKVSKVIEGAQPFDAFQKAIDAGFVREVGPTRGLPFTPSAAASTRVENGVSVICPSNPEPHRPGMLVPQPGQPPDEVSL